MASDDGVTIAIPNWNHELLLPRAIRAGLRAVEILRSAGTSAELLVVDDGSRDGSHVLLRRLEAEHYRDGLNVLAAETNAGLSPCRNLALSEARYRYIVFVDADNELIPENLPTFIDTLRSTGAAGAYGTLLIRSVTAQHSHAAFSHESFHDRMFEGNYIDACAVFDRNQLIELGGYLSQRWEDYEVWLRLAAAGRHVLFVPVVLGYYYILPNSTTTDPHENTHLHQVEARMKRVYDQVGAKSALPMATRYRRYHPALGYF